MASRGGEEGYPQPHTCVDTMQQFFQNIFGGRRRQNNNDENNVDDENHDGTRTGTGTNHNHNNPTSNSESNGAAPSQRQHQRSRTRSRPRPARSNASHQPQTQAQPRPSSTSTSNPPRSAGGRNRNRNDGDQDSEWTAVFDSPVEFFSQLFGHTPEEVQANLEAHRNDVSGRPLPVRGGFRGPPPHPIPNMRTPHGQFHFFGTQAEAAAFAAAQQAAFGEQQAPSRPNPPASCKAIRQLPTVTVTPEDLVDESNRECCICFEPHNIGDRVTRLPCAHIYHPRCIIPWLGSHSNTCPVCRYELSTDDATFEQGREERMKQRKPRYARYELERMAVRELKELALRLRLSSECLEKKELVDRILTSDKVISIEAPEPIVYPSVGVLREMKIRQLKSAMAEAGVFFDPKDVVEKEDMVQIFVNSGRIVLTDEGKEEVEEDAVMDYGHAPRAENHALPIPSQPQPPRQQSDLEEESDFVGMEKKRARIEEDNTDFSSHSTRSMRMRNNNSSSSCCSLNDNASATGSTSECVSENMGADTTANSSVHVHEESSTMECEYEDECAHAKQTSDDDDADHVASDDHHENYAHCQEQAATGVENDTSASTIIRTDHASASTTTIASPCNDGTCTTDLGTASDASSSSELLGSDAQSQSATAAAAAAASSLISTATETTMPLQNTATTATDAATHSNPHSTTPNAEITQRSVKELRQLAQELSVDLSGCLEKREMIDLIVSAVRNR